MQAIRTMICRSDGLGKAAYAVSSILTFGVHRRGTVCKRLGTASGFNPVSRIAVALQGLPASVRSLRTSRPPLRGGPQTGVPTRPRPKNDHRTQKDDQD